MNKTNSIINVIISVIVLVMYIIGKTTLTETLLFLAVMDIIDIKIILKDISNEIKSKDISVK